MKAKDFGGDSEQPVLPNYDRTSGILFEGAALKAQLRQIRQPNFRVYGDFAGFGDLLLAEYADWLPADENHRSGYLLRGVTRPESIDQIRSAGTQERLILMTSADQPWLKSGECFVATTIHSDLLQTNQSAKRIASVSEMISQVQNPAVHSAASLKVLLHERILRPPLDFVLVLLGLPLVINRGGRNLFVMIAAAIGTVLVFFLLKTITGAMGGSGYLISPSTAAWIPLLILGPIGYARLREIETV
jgi:lipopolysaccharide export system permease protein